MREVGIKKIETVEDVDPEYLPNGDYEALWGGYEVETVINGKKHRIYTTTGVRGMNIPCIVRVLNGVVSVWTLERAKQ